METQSPPPGRAGLPKGGLTAAPVISNPFVLLHCFSFPANFPLFPTNTEHVFPAHCFDHRTAHFLVYRPPLPSLDHPRLWLTVENEEGLRSAVYPIPVPRDCVM